MADTRFQKGSNVNPATPLKFHEDKRIKLLRESLNKLTTDSTTSIDGIPNLIRMSDLGGILGLKKRSVQRIVTRYFKPIGGVIKIGQRNHIFVWAVMRLLGQVGRCADCGRHWDDKLALAELTGETVPEPVKISTTGVQGGLVKLNKINKELPEGVDRYTFADVKGERNG